MNAKPLATTTVADTVVQQIQARLGPAQGKQAQVFASHFFRRISTDDIAARPIETWGGMILALLEFVRVRKAGVPSVRVFNPNLTQDGWESSHSVIDIVTDDMPFLVDSVSIAIAQAGLSLHAVIHPVYNIERDPGGHLLNLAAEGGKGKVESLMHFEVDRIGEPAERARLEQSIR